MSETTKPADVNPCMETCDYGWSCSLLLGHKGNHIAYEEHDETKELLDEWANESTPVEAPALGATTPREDTITALATKYTNMAAVHGAYDEGDAPITIDRVWLHGLFQEFGLELRAQASAPVAREGQAPDVEQLAVDLCRELYDRFMMGGWEPQDAHAETVLRLQQWAESVASPRAPETPKEQR